MGSIMIKLKLQSLKSRSLVLMLFALTSCNTNSNKSNHQDSSKDSIFKNDQISQHCYLYTHEKDSIKLNFTRNGNMIEGTLHFKNYQIDGSSGTIDGKFYGDTLWVVYDFFSEGMHSIKDEVFLQKGDTLIRGFGEYEQMVEKHQYNDKASINFKNGQSFLPLSCL